MLAAMVAGPGGPVTAAMQRPTPASAIGLVDSRRANDHESGLGRGTGHEAIAVHVLDRDVLLHDLLVNDLFAGFGGFGRFCQMASGGGC